MAAEITNIVAYYHESEGSYISITDRPAVRQIEVGDIGYVPIGTTFLDEYGNEFRLRKIVIDPRYDILTRTYVVTA